MPEIFEPVEEVAQDTFVPVSEVSFEPVEEVTVNRQPFLPEPGTANIGREPLSRTPTQSFPASEQRQQESANLPTLTAEEIEQQGFQPRIDLGRTYPEGTVKRAAENILKGIPEFLSSPLGIFTPAIQGTPAGPAMDVLMGAAMIKSGSQKLGEASVTGNHQTLAEGIGELIMGGMAGTHPALKEPLADLRAATQVGKPDITAADFAAKQAISVRDKSALVAETEKPFRMEETRPGVLTPKAEELPQTDIESVFGLKQLDEQVNANLAQGITEPSTLVKTAIESTPEVPVAHETVLPGASETFKEIVGEQPKPEGEQNAISQQSAATLGGDVLRMGEGARRENEAGLPVNEGSEGVRINEVQEPSGAQAQEVAPTEKFEPIEEVKRQFSPEFLSQLYEMNELPFGKDSGAKRLEFIERTSQSEKKFNPPTNGDEYWVKNVRWDATALSGSGGWRVTIQTPKGEKVYPSFTFREALNNPDLAAARALMTEMGSKVKSGGLWDFIESMAHMKQEDRLSFKIPGDTFSASAKKPVKKTTVAKQIAEPAPESTPKPKGIERPHDIIDDLEQLGVTIRFKGSSKPGSEGYYTPEFVELSKLGKPSRRLFSKTGHGPDEALDVLKRNGRINEDATVEDLRDAIEKANGQRRAIARGETPEAQQENFQSALGKQSTKKGSHVVSVGDLSIGDKFKIGGEEFEVRSIDPDTGDVSVKDGKKFGWQTIPDGADLSVEKGSLEQKPQAPAFTKEDFALNTAESVEQQKARLAHEEALAKEKADKEKIQEGAAKPLIGSVGDIGQKDMFGGGDLFSEEPKGPGMVGMGGALEGEVKTGAGEDIFGISQRVREKMAETGRFPYTTPGQGTTAWEQIQRGRQLIREGAKPDEVLANFERTKRLSADDMAVIRAHMENLYQQARSIESKKGTESPEYLAKQQELNNWWQRTKPMQTEWHKMGEAQQGSTDIDTGDLVSLEAAHQKATGKGFTPKQTAEAKGVSDSVKEARDAARVAQQKVIDSIDKEVEKGPQYEPRVLKMAEDFATYMDKKADAAILRLRERLKNVSAGVDPTIISDLAIVGAAKITRGIVDFAKWSDAMIRDLGEDVKPFLKDAYEASKKDFDDELNAYSAKVKGATGEQVKAAVKSKAPKAPKAPATIEETRKAVAPDKSGKITPDQVKTVWNYAKEKYINKGEGNLDAIAQGVSDDLGLPKKIVMQTMAGNKGTRQLTDEMYLKMSRQRQAESAARAWLINQQTPGWIRAAKKVPRFFFAAKVFGHGTVGMVTHAGVLMFDPLVAKQYWTNFAKQYGLAYKSGYHEAMMQDLLHRPNFAMARRAGLANDPFRFQDDYQNPAIQMGLGWFTKAGNRGFDSLKLLRQDLFDKTWGGLDDAIKTPKMAKALADDINHSTGIITSKLPGKLGEAAAVAMFAPKLEASRWAWAIGDPARAAKTLANWKNEGPEARMQAIGEIKQKARIAGTYFALLAINQGLNSAFGNGDQNVNFDNPHRGDFLAFKMFGQEVSVISPMLHMVGVLADLYRISRSEDRGKVEKLSSRRDEAGTRIWQYAQGKASPFAQPMLDLAFQTDFQGRPMPFSEDKMPKWLRREGLERYTWPEYVTQVMAPIPVAEAIKEVWDSQGMDDSKMVTTLKALTAFTVTGGTGIRVKTDKRAGE